MGNEDIDQPTIAESPRAHLSGSGRLPALSGPSQGSSELFLASGLDHSQTRRQRGFYAYGAIGTAFGLVLTIPLGGPPLAQHAFQAGVGVFAICNAAAFWLAGSARIWRPSLATAHGIINFLCLLPAIYYVGPFSVAMLMFPLGLMYIALDRERGTSTFLLVLTCVEHLVVVVPIMLGLTTDIGIAATSLRRGQMPIVEVCVLAVMIISYALGRWARHTSAMALSKLASARRIIGDQRQVMQEAQDRANEANRVKIGRWTGHLIGPWQIGSLLGRGAMGEVYDAQDGRGHAAAVKVLTAAAEESPSLVERFSRELQMAASLDSPHIVKVLDVPKASGGVPYLAMERLEGEDLATILRTRIRLPLMEVVEMLEQVASGLEVAHRAGIVHRDLKPQNLFLHASRSWKILDFGVAKVFGTDGTLTQNDMVGTPQYMAPEQMSGETVTRLGDIYALGAIAYRCLTGRAPHNARDLGALLYQVVHGAPAPPSRLAPVSRQVENVLAVAMAKDPERRFSSPTEFVELLSAAAHQRPVQIQPPANAWLDKGAALAEVTHG